MYQLIQILQDVTVYNNNLPLELYTQHIQMQANKIIIPSRSMISGVQRSHFNLVPLLWFTVRKIIWKKKPPWFKNDYGTHFRLPGGDFLRTDTATQANAMTAVYIFITVFINNSTNAIKQYLMLFSFPSLCFPAGLSLMRVSEIRTH